MDDTNPITTTDDEQFVVGESSFGFFHNNPARCDSGAILFCQRGTARVTINLHTGAVREHTLMLLLPGAILMFSEVSDDFRITYCAFSRALFAEASFWLDPSFFHFLNENPIAERLDDGGKGADIWLQMAAYTYADRENIFRNTIVKNRLQNVFLEIYDKIQRNINRRQPGEVNNRRRELFLRFISLVHEHCYEQREVAYFADRLCITTRYLSTVVRTVSSRTPKEIIDRMVLLEIKVLLQSTDLSVSEIADRLRFPDQSYLGRYFKKHTGLSPTQYRNRRWDDSFVGVPQEP